MAGCALTVSILVDSVGLYSEVVRRLFASLQNADSYMQAYTAYRNARVTHDREKYITITGSAVALHCVKAHRQSQWRSPNFNPL